MVKIEFNTYVFGISKSLIHEDDYANLNEDFIDVNNWSLYGDNSFGVTSVGGDIHFKIGDSAVKAEYIENSNNLFFYLKNISLEFPFIIIPKTNSAEDLYNAIKNGTRSTIARTGYSTGTAQAISIPLDLSDILYEDITIDTTGVINTNDNRLYFELSNGIFMNELNATLDVSTPYIMGKKQVNIVENDADTIKYTDINKCLAEFFYTDSFSTSLGFIESSENLFVSSVKFIPGRRRAPGKFLITMSFRSSSGSACDSYDGSSANIVKGITFYVFERDEIANLRVYNGIVANLKTPSSTIPGIFEAINQGGVGPISDFAGSGTHLYSYTDDSVNISMKFASTNGVFSVLDKGDSNYELSLNGAVKQFNGDEDEIWRIDHGSRSARKTVKIAYRYKYMIDKTSDNLSGNIIQKSLADIRIKSETISISDNMIYCNLNTSSIGPDDLDYSNETAFVAESTNGIIFYIDGDGNKNYMSLIFDNIKEVIYGVNKYGVPINGEASYNEDTHFFGADLLRVLNGINDRFEFKIICGAEKLSYVDLSGATAEKDFTEATFIIYAHAMINGSPGITIFYKNTIEQGVLYGQSVL